MQLRVDRVGAPLPGMPLAPDLPEADVVLVPAERARSVPGGECGRLVEEEELREPAGLHECRAVPAPELEPARDPALAVVTPPDPPLVVVEAAAVPVDEPARRVGDQLARRRHPVLQRHHSDRTDEFLRRRRLRNDDDREESSMPKITPWIWFDSVFAAMLKMGKIEVAELERAAEEVPA